MCGDNKLRCMVYVETGEGEAGLNVITTRLAPAHLRSVRGSASMRSAVRGSTLLPDNPTLTHRSVVVAALHPPLPSLRSQ